MPPLQHLPLSGGHSTRICVRLNWIGRSRAFAEPINGPGQFADLFFTYLDVLLLIPDNLIEFVLPHLHFHVHAQFKQLLTTGPFNQSIPSIHSFHYSIYPILVQRPAKQGLLLRSPILSIFYHLFIN